MGCCVDFLPLSILKIWSEIWLISNVKLCNVMFCIVLNESKSKINNSNKKVIVNNEEEAETSWSDLLCPHLLKPVEADSEFR